MKALTHNPEALSLAVLSCFFSLLPVVAPLAGVVLALLVPFPLIVLGLKYGWRYALNVMAIEAGIILLIEGVSAVFLLNYYVVVPIVMIAALRQGCSMSRTIMLSVVAPMLLGAICLGVASLMLQQSPRVLLLHAFERMVQVVQEDSQTLEQGLLVPDRPQGLDKAVPGFFLRVLPAILIMNHLFTNVFNYVLVRGYGRQSRTPLCLDPEDLACWRPSDYLVWVFLASGVLVLLPLGALSTLGLNVFLVTLMLYCLEGIAIAVFWGRQLPLSPGMQWLVGILIFVLAGPLCLLVCTAMGLFDLWVDFRRQRRPSIS